MRLPQVFASLTLIAAFSAQTYGEGEPTYAERLGWNAGDRVIILHVDDAGMSHDSNVGAMKALTQGVATSTSVLMPCSWVPEIAAFIKENPETDAGIEFAFNAEYDHYRWGPIAGAPAVPGLVDEEGFMWKTVEKVLEHASPEEIETEARAQIARARAMGFEPTHLDSHMGTILATPLYAAVYIKLGIETGIPVMLPAGHMHIARIENPDSPFGIAAMMGARLWQAGLPVIDDIVNTTLDWKTLDKTDRYIELLKSVKPGITQINMHCTEPSENFKYISEPDVITRHGDLRAMLDPRLKQAIEDEGILQTTWRELKQRRARVKAETGE